MISDGKAGHLNQSLGLAEALQRQRPNVDIRQLPAMSRAQALSGLLLPGSASQPVDLLIGAGHTTHLSLLALRRRCRCRAIVLMRPSLPVGLFDLCIQPRHDAGHASDRLWLSDGPLNRLQPNPLREDTSLMLIGGPSAHYDWEPERLLQQLSSICDGSRAWQLSTSRRTPPEFIAALRALNLPELHVHAVDDLPAGWLAQQLPVARRCWVTPDSASMVYEALTAGCGVGVFDLPPRAGSRVAGSIAGLVDRGLVIGFAARECGGDLAPPPESFAEADRCAGLILARGWL